MNLKENIYQGNTQSRVAGEREEPRVRIAGPAIMASATSGGCAAGSPAFFGELLRRQHDGVRIERHAAFAVGAGAAGSPAGKGADRLGHAGEVS